MKRFMALVLVILLLAAFSIGCKPAEQPAPEAPAPAEVPAPAPEQPAEAPAEEPVPEQPAGH